MLQDEETSPHLNSNPNTHEETISCEDVECSSEHENPEDCPAEKEDHETQGIEEKADGGSEKQYPSQSNEKEHQHLFDQLQKDVEIEQDPEAKLKKVLDFMENAISQGGTPHFKTFWQARTLCPDLFKANISPAVRSQLWNKFRDLSKEARRLKEILDEQSAFAAEQIEIAIKALENDIEKLDQQEEKPALTSFSIMSQALEEKYPFYQSTQGQLDHLNAIASRINALRKELIRTDMRIRLKNKFFQRLSLAGDKVFPRRKELVKEISQQFTNDVNEFIDQNFKSEMVESSLYGLREEIKALQGIAKILTLNTHSFTHTRMRLSECWDQIKIIEKEKKKKHAEQKVVFKQNMDTVRQKIEEFKNTFQTGNLSTTEAHKMLDEITNVMRQVQLGRDEVRILREEINSAKQPFLDKIRQEEQSRQDQEHEKIRQRKAKVVEVRQEIDALIKAIDHLSADELISSRESILGKIQDLTINKSEKLELERLLKPLRDAISDKKESALMNLSDDDRQAIEQLREVLRQRRERRQEIKNQIETLRKAAGSSGLDFEQAMVYNNQLTIEKERLEKINLGIKEIEQKLASVKL